MHALLKKYCSINTHFVAWQGLRGEGQEGVLRYISWWVATQGGSLMSAAGIFGHSRGHEREYIHYYIRSLISMMCTRNKGILSSPKSECHVLFLWYPIGRWPLVFVSSGTGDGARGRLGAVGNGAYYRNKVTSCAYCCYVVWSIFYIRDIIIFAVNDWVVLDGCWG